MTVAESCPTVLWAQRTDKVLIAIQLGDVVDEEIKLDSDCLSFKCTSGGKKYATHIEFNEGIIPEESKKKNLGREYYFELRKKDPGPFWPRLLKDKKKHLNIKVDFNRWKDEDESEDEMVGGMGGMGGGGGKYDDASLEDMMQQMGTGAEGFDPNEGCSDDDSDDDDLPELEGDAGKVNGEAVAVNGDS